MGCVGDPRRDNQYPSDYPGHGWLSGNYAFGQLKETHLVSIAAAAKAVAAVVDEIARTITSGVWMLNLVEATVLLVEKL